MIRSFVLYSCLLMGFFGYTSCQSVEDKQRQSEDELSEELKSSIWTYLENQPVFQQNGFKVLDVIINKVDTLTPYLDSLYTIQFVSQRTRMLQNESLRLLEIAQESMDLALMSARLGSELRDITKSDADKAAEKAIIAVEKSQRAQERVLSLDSLVSNNLVDSTTVTGYLVNFSVKAVDGSNVADDLVERQMIFDLDKRIVLKPEQREIIESF